MQFSVKNRSDIVGIISLSRDEEKTNSGCEEEMEEEKEEIGGCLYSRQTHENERET